MLLVTLLFVIVIGTAFGQPNPRLCGPFSKNADQPILTPASYKYYKPQAYNYTGSALQIFTSARVECDGWLQKWRFLALNPVVYGLHLAVFRFDNYTMEDGEVEGFQLVGETKFTIYETVNATEKVWTEVAASPLLEVQAGDFLGVYYDDFESVTEMLTVTTIDYNYHAEPMRSGNKKSEAPVQPTFVYMADSSNIDSSFVLQKTYGEVKYRWPALTALIYIS